METPTGLPTNATAAVRVPNVEVYSLNAAGERHLEAAGVLEVVRMAHGARDSVVFLWLGTWCYPLVGQLVLRVDPFNYVLPSNTDVTYAICVTKPPVRAILDELVSTLTTRCQVYDRDTHSAVDAHGSVGGEEPDVDAADDVPEDAEGEEEGVVAAAAPAVPVISETITTTTTTVVAAGAAAPPVPVRKHVADEPALADDQLVPVVVETKEEVTVTAAAVVADDAQAATWADTIGWGLTTASSVLSTGLVKGAEWASWGISKTAEWAVGSTPAAAPQEHAVSEGTLENLETAKSVGDAAVSVSSSVVYAVSAMAEAIGRTVANYVIPAASSDPATATTVTEVNKVATSGITAAANVLDALERASSILCASTSTATTKVVTHRYGSRAGQAAAASMHVATSVGKTVWNVKSLGKAALAKHAAKHAAKQAVALRSSQQTIDSIAAKTKST